MQHIWTILCQITSEDKQSGAFSIINVLDRIQITSDPNLVAVDDIVIPINFHLVSMWWREESEQCDEVLVKIKLYSPDKEDLGDLNISFSLSESLFSRVNVNIKGFPYKGDGIYIYKVFHVLDDNPVEVQKIPINVEHISEIKQDQESSG